MFTKLRFQKITQNKPKPMKNLLQSLFLLIAVIGGAVLTSCTFTEKIYIEEDGTGSYAMDMDLSEILTMANSMGEEADSEEDAEAKVEKVPEIVDTTILISSIIEQNKDSIADLPEEERLLLESMKDAKMHMYMNEEEGKFLMNFIYDFNQVTELRDMQSKVAKAYSISNKKEDKASSPSNTTFEYSKKSFKRVVTIKKMTKKEKEELDSSMEEMAMFMMGSTYNIEYHFPKKIKSTNAKDATFSEDRKTIFISVPFEELLGDESILDFEVKF